MGDARPADGEGDQHELLIGAAGSEFVARTLSTSQPQDAIALIHQKGSLPNARAVPLLGLLDHLRLSRSESHQAICEVAQRTLLERIKSLKPDKLLALLEASFPYLGIPELRAVPLAVLAELQPVPAAFLKQLSADKELFHDLPLGVKRQVWELDTSLLRRHAMPLLHAHANETATTVTAFDMDPRPVAPEPAKPPAPDGKRAKMMPPKSMPRLPRHKIRLGSNALKNMYSIVGQSPRLYRSLVSLCRMHFADHGRDTVCSLRSQLLMGLHDRRENDLCQQDPTHKLAWTLDAGVRDRHLDERRILEVRAFFDSVPSTGGGGEEREVEGGSRAGGDDNTHVLGDAGMILRDPPVLHLLLQQMVDTLDRVVESEGVPGKDEDLCFLSQLVQLALGTRRMLHERTFYLPGVDKEHMRVYFPLLAAVMLESKLRDSDDETEAEAGEAGAEVVVDEKLVEYMRKDELARKVTMMYILSRLMADDVATALPLLAAVAELDDSALCDEPAFASTLSRRLAKLSSQGGLKSSNPLWKIGVEGILLRAAGSGTYVHEEVLRLVEAAAPHLDVEVLASALEMSLHTTRKSRKRHKKRRAKEMEMDEEGIGGLGGGSSGYGTDGGAGGGYASDGPRGGYASDGRAGYTSDGGNTSASEGFLLGQGGGGAGGSGTDGVRATYQLIAKNYASSLTEDLAPSLFQYLRKPE